MGLLGAPRYTIEKNSHIITEKDIIEAIRISMSLESIDSYDFSVMNEDDDDYNELLVKVSSNGNVIGPMDASYFLHSVPILEKCYNLSYWLSKNEEDHYVYIVHSK